MSKTFVNSVIAIAAIIFNCGIAAAKSTKMEEPQMTEQQTKQIDDLFSQWNKTDSPGFALGIVKNGKFVYTQNYGMADVEKQIPITGSTIFNIASMTKQFTAAALVLLSEQGKLSLDDKLTKYFPSFPAYADKITIRHLLNHTSGIRAYEDLYFIQGNNYGDYMTDSQIVDLLSRQQELNTEPGAEFKYSNSGYRLAGLIVSKVSGIPFAEFVKQNLLEPLNMQSSSLYNPLQDFDKNMANGYRQDQNNSYQAIKITESSGGEGSLISTVDDLKKWDDNFYVQKIGGEKFVETMQTAGLLNDGNKTNYALGLSVDQYKNIKYIRHGGGTWGFRSDHIRFPEQELSVILFANNETDPEPLLFKIVDILLGEQPNTETNSKSFKSSTEEYDSSLNQPDDLQAMDGVYHCPELDVTYDIRLEDEKLTVYLGDTKDCVMQQYLPGIYRYFGFFLKFIKGDDNKYSEIRLNSDSISGLKFVRQK